MSLKFQITAVLRELSVYDNVLLALQARTVGLVADPLRAPRVRCATR